MILFQLSALAAVAFLLGVVQLSGADHETCSYTGCVFDGISQKSYLEEHFIMLKINKIPRNIRKRCLMLQQRAAECYPEYVVGCPTEVTLGYERRLEDPAYVNFLMTLGEEICNNLDRYLKLINCFTDKLQTDLQKCMYHYRYDIPRLLNAFHELNHCSNEEQEIFLDLFNNWLVKNPYLRHLG